MADGNLQSVRLVEPTVFDIGQLCVDMRPDEIEQWCALTGFATYDPNLAATSVIRSLGPASFCIIDPQDRPIVVGGFVEKRPHVFQTWMVGTEQGWDRHWRAITKHSRRAIDGLLEKCAHRVETVALASRKKAHVWYEHGLGMSFECVRPRYFADGQDGVMFAKVRKDHERT